MKVPVLSLPLVTYLFNLIDLNKGTANHIDKCLRNSSAQKSSIYTTFILRDSLKVAESHTHHLDDQLSLFTYGHLVFA